MPVVVNEIGRSWETWKIDVDVRGKRERWYR